MEERSRVQEKTHCHLQGKIKEAKLKILTAAKTPVQFKEDF